MTKAPAASETFTVTYSAPFEASGVPAGVIAIDATHHVSVVSAEPGFADKLDLAATMLNSSDDFLLRDTPPPGASPRGQYRRIVSRDAADARQALLEILQANYGFELKSTG